VEHLQVIRLLNGGVLIKMAWSKNGTPNTLSSSDTDCDVTDLVAGRFLVYLKHRITSGLSNNRMTFNNSNTGYTGRYEADGTGYTLGSVAYVSQHTNSSGDSFAIGYVANIPTQQKLVINFIAGSSATGAGTAPTKYQQYWKWNNTADSITRIDTTDTLAGSMDTGTNLTVLNGDTTEEATLQDGTIFEETDTNKSYIWNATSQTWTQL
jgi:hypothetical protein